MRNLLTTFVTLEYLLARTDVEVKSAGPSAQRGEVEGGVGCAVGLWIRTQTPCAVFSQEAAEVWTSGHVRLDSAYG